MSLIKRSCPLCGSGSYKEVVALKEHHFTRSNPSYRLKRIPELGLDPEESYPIAACAGCGMIYSLYKLEDAKEVIVYNRIIDLEKSKDKVLSDGRRRADLKRWENLSRLAGEEKPDMKDLKILDYGCGWGTLLLTAKRAGVETIGFEVASKKVEWARQKGLTIYDSEEELFKNAPFDICVSTSLLEHMGDPALTIKKITSLLKPGGFAHITAAIGGVAPFFFWRSIRNRVRKNLPIPKEVNPWEHLNYFTHGSFVKLLGKYGLRPLSASGRRYVVSKFPKIWSSGYWQLKKTS